MLTEVTLRLIDMAALLYVCISIVTLMSYNGMGQSLSRQKTVTLSTLNTDWVGSRAVDGNYNRDFSKCSCCAGTSPQRNLVDQWMEVDFGQTTEFNRIVVYGQTSGTWPRQNLEGLSIHLDNSETSIASIEYTGQGYVNFHHFDLDQKYSARRIKLILKGSDKVLTLCEVDVFNDSIISNGKDVTAISTYSDWNPSRAVDGNMRTDPEVCLCCAATAFHTAPWINVDLRNEFLITFIQIFGRTDRPASGQSFEGMSISVDDVIIYNVSTTNTFISNIETVTTPAPVGRNVKFTLTGRERLLLMCEVVIHGVCKAGTYGTNCEETCSNCKDGNTCNYVTGYCTGCEDGYIETDKTCKTQCSTGYYGRNCTMPCGSCKNEPTCDHVDGRCGDCANGTYVYDDKSCNEACEPHFYGYNCTGDCGNCRNGVPCNSMNGDCMECEDGFTNIDKRCNTECPSGTFGQNCQHTCGMCACGEICDGRTGNCPSGCSNGYLGEACLQRISQDEATETTISLPVYIGSLIGAIVLTVAIMLGIMYWKLRRIKASSSERGEGNGARVPSTRSEAASNYDALQLSNIQSESDYSESQ